MVSKIRVQCQKFASFYNPNQDGSKDIKNIYYELPGSNKDKSQTDGSALSGRALVI
jgi:hypothetical protein